MAPDRPLTLLGEDENNYEATSANRRTIVKIDKRAVKPGAVIGPCLKAYKHQIEGWRRSTDLLSNLTAPLLDAREETEKLIRARMEAKWVDKPENIPGSVTNSLRRSAGTNYQGLVSYALALYLLEAGSAWYLQHPVPKELREALAINFTAGIPLSEPEEGGSPSVEADDAEVGDGDDFSVFRVQPDVDILLRNASWEDQQGQAEPVMLLSVKTSLVDRAGMAARWKTYFDQVTHPCPLLHKPGCAYSRLGITMENADRYDIHHGIVTANIYKYNFHDVRYKKGELSSGQTRSNTYMFDHKLTTRDDDLAETPEDWRQLPHVVDVLETLSRRHGLPN